MNPIPSKIIIAEGYSIVFITFYNELPLYSFDIACNCTINMIFEVLEWSAPGRNTFRRTRSGRPPAVLLCALLVTLWFSRNILVHLHYINILVGR